MSFPDNLELSRRFGPLPFNLTLEIADVSMDKLGAGQ